MNKMFLSIILGLALSLSFVYGQELEGGREIENVDIEDDVDDVSTSFKDVMSPNNEPLLHKYYLGEGVRFSSRDGNYLMVLNGYLQSSLQTHMYSGDEDIYQRWRIRRGRVRISGIAHQDKIRYRIGVDMVKNSETDQGTGGLLMDAWVAYRPWGDGRLSITFGQRSTQTDNRENFMNSSSLQLVERSRLSAMFGTVREVGFTVQSSTKLGKFGYLRPTLILTDGDGAYTRGKRFGGLKYGGRIEYLPFGLFRSGGAFHLEDMVYELSPKLSVGGAYSYNDGASDRRGGRDSGEILYQNSEGYTDLPDFARLNLDLLFKFRGWSVLGEYTKTNAFVPSSITTRVRNDGSTTGDFEIDGVQDVEGYIKNRMILGSAYNLQGGYMFRDFWSVNARYTHIKPDRFSYLNNDLYYKRNNVYELSIAKYLTKNYATKIQLSGSLQKTDGEVRYHNGTFSGYEKTIYLLTQISF